MIDAIKKFAPHCFCSSRLEILVVRLHGAIMDSTSLIVQSL
ncbi:hypothetical protein [Bartonella jaculi]